LNVPRWIRAQTVLSLAAPLDKWEADPNHLRDEQKAQLFFNVLVWELVVLAMMVRSLEVTSGGSVRLLTTIVKGLIAASFCVLVAIVCRIAFRLGNKRTKGLLRRARDRSGAAFDRLGVPRPRLCVAWLFNLSFFAGSMWCVVAYGRCYTHSETTYLLNDWLASLAISFLVTEPIQILLVLLLPCIFKSRACESCVEWMRNAGIDPGSLLA
jgi:hypothetical protein